ncbi:MAG: DUF2273 domain-containing protein [Xylanivirga thermophila]|jgi:uncharacterized membrane protein|uniref:DUF2273 domain-containing protein n=1 Tax=Xylanivirga thermophila TaxID=2496273 RepID=UPI0039F5A58A
MSRDDILYFLKENKGKVFGILIGLIFGILILSIGFWRSFFLILCVLIGYWIGYSRDNGENFLDFLDRILPKRH